MSPAGLFDPIDVDTLYRIEPDFERLAFVNALSRSLLIGTLDHRPCVVMSDQADDTVWDWLQGRLDGSERFLWVAHDDLLTVLNKHGEKIKALQPAETPPDSSGDDDYERLSLQALQNETNLVVRTLGSTLFDAYRSLASDIHLEATAHGLEIKYRIDGTLTMAGSLHDRLLAQQLISRLKVLARLDVGERRVPQDGRFRIGLDARVIDLRVSVIPSIHGEDAVLRLLDRRALAEEGQQINLDQLGLDAAARMHIRQLARKPHGMLLMTGPTGSGKTTTLYAALTEINDGLQKIITIEDPVEYQLQGVLQVPVNDRTGLTFARGLRAILRHDPDVILVGEIRDEETAQIAVQSALTGHLVFSSIHANGAVDVIGRFAHMGIDPYNLTSAMNGVIAQRLLRLNCPRCIERRPIEASLMARHAAVLGNITHHSHGRGCGECRGTGFRGRCAVAEVLVLDDDMREAIVRREPPRALRLLAQGKGMSRMVHQAAQLVAQEKISIEEFCRVAEMD
jgi:general secretion pathway protein E